MFLNLKVHCKMIAWNKMQKIWVHLKLITRRNWVRLKWKKHFYHKVSTKQLRKCIFNNSKNYSNWGTPYVICEKSVFLTGPINQSRNYKSWIFLHLFQNLLLFFIWPRWFLSQHWLGNSKLRKVPLCSPFCAKSYFNQIKTINKFRDENLRKFRISSLGIGY